jgi:hypothetical protein
MLVMDMVLVEVGRLVDFAVMAEVADFGDCSKALARLAGVNMKRLNMPQSPGWAAPLGDRGELAPPGSLASRWRRGGSLARVAERSAF